MGILSNTHVIANVVVSLSNRNLIQTVIPATLLAGIDRFIRMIPDKKFRG